MDEAPHVVVVHGDGGADLNDIVITSVIGPFKSELAAWDYASRLKLDEGQDFTVRELIPAN